MARPTQTRLPNAPGYGPEQGRSAPALQVVAPLNVQAPKSGAELLANSLGIAMDNLAPAATRFAKGQNEDSRALGRADGATGTVDEKEQEQNKHYAMGVKRAMVDRALVDFKTQAREFYNEKFDKSQGTEALMEALDGITKGALQNYTGDADAAAWLLPEVMQEVGVLTGEHDKLLSGQFKQDRIATVGSLMRDAVDSGETFDPEDMKGRMAAVLGRGEATKAYAEIVGTMAVERGQPEIIDAFIPEKWADGTPGPRSIPELNQYLNQSRYYAESADRQRESELSAAAKKEADAFSFQLTIKALTGVNEKALTSEAALAHKAGMPISDETVRAIVLSSRSAQAEADDRRFDPVVQARMRALLVTDPKSVSPADMVSFVANNFPIGKAGADAGNRMFDDYVSAQRAAERVSNDPLAKAYKDSLLRKHTPAAVDSPSQKEKATFAEGMLAFDRVMADGGTPDDALTAANTFFEKVVPSTVKATGNLKSDLASFSSQTLNSPDFVAAHKRAGNAEKIAQMALSGEITREQAEAAIRAIRSK